MDLIAAKLDETAMQRGLPAPTWETGSINFATQPVGFQQYLILGKEKALLIDSGMGIKRQSLFPFTAVMTFSQLGNHAGKGMGKYMGERDMYEKITF